MGGVNENVKCLLLLLITSPDASTPPVQVHAEIDLHEVYGSEEARHRYRLRSMVCYYGSHYQALVLVPLPGGSSWLLFDDEAVSLIGGWQDVIVKCEAGRIQPSVLFYELS